VNRTGYSFLLYLLSPVIWGYLLLRAIKAPEYRDGLLQRLGFSPKNIQTAGILIHCASVGETMAAKPLINHLISAYPNLSITITTTTPTGKKAVLNTFADKVTHCYLPIDWPGCCKRFLNRLKPKIVILMETELWPNFVAHSAHNNIPIMLANARLSKKSLNKYLKFPKISNELFSDISKVTAQYQSDQDNFLELGVHPEKIELVGSIKFDIEISKQLKQQQADLRKQWLEKTNSTDNEPKARPVWIAASIHPEEFELVLETHQLLLEKVPELLLIAVPRHPEKFEQLKSDSKKHNLTFVSRSDNQAPDENVQVVVGDTMGEMTLFCGLSDISFVGGSLIERGGHNPLEPIACGAPVLMGPSYYNFSDVCQILINEKVMQVILSAEELSISIEKLLMDNRELSVVAEKSLSIMQKYSGCVNKMIYQVNLLIEKKV